MRILLSGFFGFGNAGDEMIYSVLERNLIDEGFEVLSLVKSPSQPKEIKRDNFAEIFSAIRFSDVVISGGGGLLQDVTSSKSLYYYLLIIKWGIILGKKTVVFAQGVGPIDKCFNRFFVKSILGKVDLITVRDSFSRELLSKIGIKKEVFVTGDLALLFDDKKETKVIENEDYIILSLAGSRGMPSIEKLVEIAHRIREVSSRKIYILPLFAAKDMAICREVADKASLKVLTELTPEEMSYIISKAEFLIGVRYHSILMSAMNFVPFISLSYDPKVNTLTQELGMTSFSYKDLTIEDFTNAFKYCFTERSKLKDKLKSRIPVMKENAKGNFEILFNFLSR